MCTSLGYAFLFFLFFCFRIRALEGFEWLTSSPFSTLGADLFRIVTNRYFRSPWQPPVPYLQRIRASKGPWGNWISGWELIPSSFFLCCHIQAGSLFQKEERLVGRKDCSRSWEWHIKWNPQCSRAGRRGRNLKIPFHFEFSLLSLLVLRCSLRVTPATGGQGAHLAPDIC